MAGARDYQILKVRKPDLPFAKSVGSRELERNQFAVLWKADAKRPVAKVNRKVNFGYRERF